MYSNATNWNCSYLGEPKNRFRTEYAGCRVMKYLRVYMLNKFLPSYVHCRQHFAHEFGNIAKLLFFYTFIEKSMQNK